MIHEAVGLPNDEPSLGPQPNVAGSVFETISQINRDTGTTILIVEQKVRQVLKLCHKVYSIKLEKVAFTGPPDELKQDKDKLKQLFL